MTEGDRVALALGQARHMHEQGFVLDPLLGHRARVGFGHRLVLDRAPQALAPAVSAEVVGRRIPRDAKEPRHGARVARFESAVRLVRVHEDLGRDVLGVGGRGDLRADIGVDATEVVAVQIFEWGPIVGHGRFMVLASTAVLTQRPAAGSCNAPLISLPGLSSLLPRFQRGGS